MLGASEMPEKGVWCGFKTEVRRTVDPANSINSWLMSLGVHGYTLFKESLQSCIVLHRDPVLREWCWCDLGTVTVSRWFVLVHGLFWRHFRKGGTLGWGRSSHLTGVLLLHPLGLGWIEAGGASTQVGVFTWATPNGSIATF